MEANIHITKDYISLLINPSKKLINNDIKKISILKYFDIVTRP